MSAESEGVMSAEDETVELTPIGYALVDFDRELDKFAVAYHYADDRATARHRAILKMWYHDALCGRGV